MALEATINAALTIVSTEATPTGDLFSGSGGSARAAVSHGVRLTTGTAAGQADVVWADTRSIAGSGTDSIDLAGVLTNVFGAAANFARVKAIYVRAAAANAGNIVVGDAAANPWAALLGADGTVTVRPGASFMATAGDADATAWAVTAGTADILLVTNSVGSAVTYDIVVVGASA